jgi:hypothetical protein
MRTLRLGFATPTYQSHRPVKESNCAFRLGGHDLLTF